MYTLEVYLVSPSEHLYKGGSLLNGLQTHHDPHSHHRDGVAEVVSDLDGEATALGVDHVEAVGGQSVFQLLLVVHV